MVTTTICYLPNSFRMRYDRYTCIIITACSWNVTLTCKKTGNFKVYCDKSKLRVPEESAHRVNMSQTCPPNLPSCCHDTTKKKEMVNVHRKSNPWLHIFVAAFDQNRKRVIYLAVLIIGIWTLFLYVM